MLGGTGGFVARGWHLSCGGRASCALAPREETGGRLWLGFGLASRNCALKFENTVTPLSVYTRTHARTLMHAHTHTHARMLMHAHTRTHTHTHTRTRTHMHRSTHQARDPKAAVVPHIFNIQSWNFKPAMHLMAQSWETNPRTGELKADGDVPAYAPRAVQFHPHGSQSDFVWLSARTPHGGALYVW